MEIYNLKSSGKFCYFDEDENMVDITDKCPLELYQNICYMLGSSDVFEVDTSIPVEDIYDIIVERTYSQPENGPRLNLSDKTKSSLKISFNKFFISHVSKVMNVKFDRVCYL